MIRKWISLLLNVTELRRNCKRLLAHSTLYAKTSDKPTKAEVTLGVLLLLELILKAC
ncbi:hypothetical protein ACFFGV_08440 [Pontibacillus salicampi]|uniref:Uncharacterized protein n=1 Tax=Pontibacillus salicampi TaxID=1449801 RepID=A0ABV6LMK6_9BACI